MMYVPYTLPAFALRFTQRASAQAQEGPRAEPRIYTTTAGPTARESGKKVIRVGREAVASVDSGEVMAKGVRIQP